MKGALLALLLSSEPVRFIAVEPAPERVAQVIWVHGEQETPGLYLTDAQAILVAARMEALEEELAAAQVEAAEERVRSAVPPGAWLAAGAATAAVLFWAVPPAVEAVKGAVR